MTMETADIIITADVIVRIVAKSMLHRTRAACLMFAATKEAFVARCAAALEMCGYADMQGFYKKHIRGYPDAPNSFNLTEAPTEAWALAVVDDALARLGGPDFIAPALAGLPDARVLHC